MSRLHATTRAVDGLPSVGMGRLRLSFGGLTALSAGGSIPLPDPI